MINNRNAGRRRGRGGQRQQGGGGRQESGNRIDNRARGNANQLLEKYKNLAAEAQRQGDRVNTEYYLQFADHYFRVLADNRARFEESNPQARRQREEAEDGYDDDFDGEIDAVEPGDRRDDRWNGNVRRNRDDQPARDEMPVTAEPPTAPAETADDGDGDGWRRSRRARGRNRREDESVPAAAVSETDGDGQADRLSAAVLPPSIQMGVEGEPARDDELPPTPRRRGRPRKSEAAAAEAAAE